MFWETPSNGASIKANVQSTQEEGYNLDASNTGRSTERCGDEVLLQLAEREKKKFREPLSTRGF